MPAYRRILDGLNFIICVVLVVVGTVLTAVVTVNVFLRYAFGRSLLFGDELSRYLLIWFGFMGMVLGVHEGAHAGFDLLKRRMPHRVQRALSMVTIVLVMAYAALMLRGALQLVPIRLAQQASTMRISIVWSFLAVPVSYGLIILRLAYSMICFIGGKDEGLKSVASLIGPKGDNVS